MACFAHSRWPTLWELHPQQRLADTCPEKVHSATRLRVPTGCYSRGRGPERAHANACELLSNGSTLCAILGCCSPMLLTSFPPGVLEMHELLSGLSHTQHCTRGFETYPTCSRSGDIATFEVADMHSKCRQNTCCTTGNLHWCSMGPRFSVLLGGACVCLSSHAGQT